MAWTTASDLKAQVARLWERGELLRTLVGGESRCSSHFPLRLTLKGPDSSELAERFDAVRQWIAALAAVPRLRIEWRELNHRVLGAQRLPQSLWLDTVDDALAMIGKRGEAARFLALFAQTAERNAALLAWLVKRPLSALELADDWPCLLDVVDWMVAHPRPGLYLRQVDLPGIHSKFIEAHRGVLAELFDLALPASAVASEYTGVGRFAARYGFREKPERIRLRVLDERIALLPGVALPDLTLDAASFARLDAPIKRVFITENETNFLAFPPAESAIVIFGAGYGWEALAGAQWLSRCAIHYWGDIDTHGFAILDQLRRRFAHVESFLMDRATLLAHQALWGEEPEPVVHDLPMLTEAERALYDELRDNRIRERLRLEQERVGFAFVRSVVANLVVGSL
ncbi:DUF3322 domain-containing protein [Propionivibrio limicola]|uniref:DUF3322 domain-containing protein n=1 Tax=Propionivibrio limicola TaxID=167645 RepID=UPI001291073B|nr:DUF3322 domain-containing protein [Propionivibrio limicola]